MSNGLYISTQKLPMLSSLAVITIFFVPVSLLHRKVRVYAAFVINLLFTILIMTDLLHLRYFSDLFTFNNIGLLNQVGEITESIFALIRISDILYFIDIPILALFIIKIKKTSKTAFINPITVKRIIVSFIVFSLAIFTLTAHVQRYNRKVPGAIKSMWDRTAVCSNIGAPTYHVVDAINVLRESLFREKLSVQKEEETVEWFKMRYENKNAKSSPLYGIAKDKNLIIIQVEALQQFVVDFKLDGVEITPNLNKFIRESAYFSRLYNQTASGNSSDAEFLVNSGLYPAASGVAFTRFAGNSYEALPRLLQNNGYSTIALHGDRPGFWNRNHMYPALGFQKYISKEKFIMDENIGMGLSDRSFFIQTAAILEKESRPFYAFLVTLSSHYPFSFPPLLAQSDLEVGELEGMFIGNYLKSMRYFDNQFGMFINDLKKRGLLESSIIVVYGDHTAIPIWDRPNFEKLLKKDLKNTYAWREILKVPLIIRVPGEKRPVFAENKKQAGLIDVARTVGSLLGIDYNYGFGHDLFDSTSQPVIFRNATYIMDFAFVEPASESATDLRSGKALEYADYKKTTKDVEKRLYHNDNILNYNLIPQIQKRINEKQ